MDLKGFFRGVPHAILAQYKSLFLSTEADSEAALKSAILGIAPAEVEELAVALDECFSNRRWVRSQWRRSQNEELSERPGGDENG